MFNFKSSTKSNKVKKSINTILEYAISEKIDEIIITPRKDGLVICYNINGVINRIATLKTKMLPEMLSYIISSSRNVSYKKSTRHRVMSIKKNGHTIIANMTISPHTLGEKINIKLSKRIHELKDLNNIGFTDNDVQKIKKNINKKNGIVLIIGPEMSGKTTTLYSMLKELNDQSRNIHVIENTTHIDIGGINQQNTSTDKEQTTTTIKELLGQDIDVIALDEITDKKQAEVASMASNSGNLILTTLKNDNQGNMYNTMRYFLPGKINCIIRQGVVKKICKNCITEDEKTEKEINAISEKINTYSADGIKNTRFYKGAGCSKCNEKGYTENIILNDVLEINSKTLGEIEKGADYCKIYKIARKNGKTDIIDNGINLAKNGIIKIDDLIKTI